MALSSRPAASNGSFVDTGRDVARALRLLDKMVHAAPAFARHRQQKDLNSLAQRIGRAHVGDTVSEALFRSITGTNDPAATRGISEHIWPAAVGRHRLVEQWQRHNPRVQLPAEILNWARFPQEITRVFSLKELPKSGQRRLSNAVVDRLVEPVDARAQLVRGGEDSKERARHREAALISELAAVGVGVAARKLWKTLCLKVDGVTVVRENAGGAGLEVADMTISELNVYLAEAGIEDVVSRYSRQAEGDSKETTQALRRNFAERLAFVDSANVTALRRQAAISQEAAVPLN